MIRVLPELLSVEVTSQPSDRFTQVSSDVIEPMDWADPSSRSNASSSPSLAPFPGLIPLVTAAYLPPDEKPSLTRRSVFVESIVVFQRSS